MSEYDHVVWMEKQGPVFFFVFLYAFQPWFFWNSKTVIQIIQAVSISACHEPFISIVLACNQSHSLEGV